MNSQSNSEGVRNRASVVGVSDRVAAPQVPEGLEAP